MSPSMNEMRQAAVTRQLGGSTRSRSLWLGVEGLQDAVSGERWSLAEAQQGRAGLDLLLSEHLLLPLVADADLPLDGGDEIRSHAAQLLVHYHGASAQSWPLAPWAEGRGGQRRCGAWAWTSPEPWTALRPLLRSARPASLACLAACRQQEPRWAQAPHAALAWVEGGLLCWMELQAGVLQAARHLRLAAPSPEALCQRLQALLAGLPAGTETLLAGHGLSAPLAASLDGVRCLTPLDAAPPAALPWARPAPLPGESSGDFMPPVEPLARWRWPLLGVASLCLALAAQEGWQAHAQWQAAGQDLARLQARQAPARAGAHAPNNRPAIAGHKMLTEALTEAKQSLQQPWQAVLAQIESAALDDSQRPRVAWLALDLQASRGELRLEGQAEDRAQILAVTDALSRLPGWREVLPGAIQPEEGGRPGLRFILQARLTADALAAAPAPATSGAGS